MRNTIRRMMLGTALVAGLLGSGAVAANAAPRDFRGPVGREPVGREYARGYDRPAFRGYERGYGYGPGFGVAVGAPYASAYIPPSPGDGYVWLGGAWAFRGGYRGGYGYGPVARFDRGGYRGRR